VGSLTLRECEQRIKGLKRVYARAKAYPFNSFQRKTEVHAELTRVLDAMGIQRALVYHGINTTETFEPVGLGGQAHRGLHRRASGADAAAARGLTPKEKAMDVILFQRISGGWEYRYTRDCVTYSGFDRDPAAGQSATCSGNWAGIGGGLIGLISGGSDAQKDRTNTSLQSGPYFRCEKYPPWFQDTFGGSYHSNRSRTTHLDAGKNQGLVQS
jgi:hypothetical protein